MNGLGPLCTADIHHRDYHLLRWY